MDITPIVRPLFAKRQKQIDLFERYGDEIQKKQLYSLLETAQNTEIGKLYRFKKIPDYKNILRTSSVDYIRRTENRM